MTLRKNMDCPACAAQRLHSQLEWNTHHPYRGHGYTREQGWTHPDLKAEADAIGLRQGSCPIEMRTPDQEGFWSGTTK